MGEIFLHRLRKTHLIAHIRGNGHRAEIRRIGHFKGPADGSKHQAEPLRVPDAADLRRVQKLLVEQEDNPCGKSRPGQGLVQLV